MDIDNDSPNVTASSSNSATKRTENMGGDDNPELGHINDSLNRQSLVLLNLIEESVPLTLKEESIPDEIWEKLSLTEEEEDMDTTVIHVPTSSLANDPPSGDALVSDNPDKPLLLRQKAVEEESGASEEPIDKMDDSLNPQTSNSAKAKEARDKKSYRRSTNYCNRYANKDPNRQRISSRNKEREYPRFISDKDTSSSKAATSQPSKKADQKPKRKKGSKSSGKVSTDSAAGPTSKPEQRVI
ncbi:uncharacterized protein [Musca autumnalis]|uniref:uncharacterized protein n=1 Tax=Musca autumnalis TaxID=221902 RepID=UPI003CEB7255